MKKYYKWVVFTTVIMAMSIISALASILANKETSYIGLAKQQQSLVADREDINSKYESLVKEYEILKNSDQIKTNKELTKQINDLKEIYKNSIAAYENILELRSSTKVGQMESLWADIVSALAKNDEVGAATILKKLETSITKAKSDLAAVPIPSNIPLSNTPPTSGFAKQVVTTDSGSHVVDVVTADLNSVKLIVDTASDGDCSDNCPVNSLDFYAKRSGAFAAINGPYFCPETYPSCADKKNSFDTLLMNKNKVYFNSNNNVYSSNPVAIFSTSGRFEEKGQSWGRDTSIDSVIMGRPLLVLNNEIRFGGNSDVKETSKGNRSFIGATGNKVYIGVVHNSTVTEMARVLQKMGISNAINLDSGGSTAMWVNGKYINGPGRNLPFGIILVNR